MMINYYTGPEPPVEPPEDKVICRCSRCGGEIYEGETYGEGQRGPVCTECLESQWQSLTMREKYESLGFWPVEVA